MTTSFADYVAQQDARNTIQLNVRKWTMMLCDALEHNFTEYVRAHKRSANLTDRVEDKAYHEMKIKEAQESVLLSLLSKKVVSISRSCSVTLVVNSVHAFVDRRLVGLQGSIIQGTCQGGRSICD